MIVYIITHIPCYSFIYNMRNVFLSIPTEYKKNFLHLIFEDNEAEYIPKIILFKDEPYTVPEIRKITNHHDLNIREWIHCFNEKGIDGIISKNHSHKHHKFDNNIEKQILDITFANS